MAAGQHFLRGSHRHRVVIGKDTRLSGYLIEPALTVVLVHGGGFFPYHVGRFDRGHQTRPEVRRDGAQPPSTYLRRFYYDTLLQRSEALAYLAGIVGHDRVLLGSDHPFWLGDPEPLGVVREARLGAEAEAAILGGNAVRLFRLPGA